MFSTENQDVQWTSLRARSSLVDPELSSGGSMITNPRTGAGQVSPVTEKHSFQQYMANVSNYSEQTNISSNPMAPSSIQSEVDSRSYINMKSSYVTPPATTNIDQDDVQARLLKLRIDTGYEIVQRNGQRIFGGPPPGWEGDLPGKGTEIYCYKIPRDCFEDELVPLFSKVGPIYELRLMIEFSGTNRTYCYVRYTKREHAVEAIGSLDGHEIRRGHALAVTKSVDNRRLWINGIPKNRSGEEFKEELGLITDGISNVILYPSQTEANRSRSYMFVEYESHRAAALARRKLVPGKVFLFGVEVGQVDWAEPEPEVDEIQMRHVKVLYVRHLNMATSEETIWSCFQELSQGHVERVKKPKDFAFVHFTSRESAELALTRCDHLEIDGQTVEVLWAKPPDRDHVAKKLDREISRGPAPASLTTPNYSPAQILELVCQSNQWGDPDYYLNCARDPSTGISLYHYRVTIPRYPATFPGNVFQAQTWMMSEIAAKTVAAQHILSQLKLGSTNIQPLTSRAYGHPFTQSQPMASPAYGHPFTQSQPMASPAYGHPFTQSQPMASSAYPPNQPRFEATESWAQVFPQFAATTGRRKRMDNLNLFTGDNFTSEGSHLSHHHLD